MLQVQKKWEVVVLFGPDQSRADLTFWVRDNFLSNVLHTVAGLDFCDGAAQPRGVNITEVITPSQVGSVSGVTSGGVTSW